MQNVKLPNNNNRRKTLLQQLSTVLPPQHIEYGVGFSGWNTSTLAGPTMDPFKARSSGWNTSTPAQPIVYNYSTPDPMVEMSDNDDD
ncbi:hypothetical protein PVK06_012356 [Gossypium arboreum]|uniref:Uncharacterized protein n=1 Tax=Gossypium arboreum TaxID=29729 RepID=A0ABR0QBJ3_GOSAR|nr:hypothetical protein PVK06_012356 [Gossypium arboreum]